MPSSTPCLGCGFELDADGYLVRKNEISKSHILGGTWSVGGFKYCDPATQRSWDVPWYMPWGLYDESVNTINTICPPGVNTRFFTMPNRPLWAPANAYYAPFRRVRLEGWVEVGVFGGTTISIFVGANNIISPALTTQGFDQATFGLSIPISVGMGGPGLAYWSTWWNTTQPSSGAYAQFILEGTTAGTTLGNNVSKVALEVHDDGPAVGLYYTTANRYWPSPVPYP